MSVRKFGNWSLLNFIQRKLIKPKENLEISTYWGVLKKMKYMPMQCQRSDKEKKKKQLKKCHCSVKEVTNKCKINSEEVQKSARKVTKKWQRN